MVGAPVIESARVAGRAASGKGTTRMSNGNWQYDPSSHSSGQEPSGNAYDPSFNARPQQHPGSMGGHPMPLSPGQIPPGSPVPVSPQEVEAERGMASFTHWGAIFLSWIAGVIGLLAKPPQGGRYQELHAKESLNFSIIMIIGYMVSGALALAWVGWLMLPALAVFDIIQRVNASSAASHGRMPTYWLPFRAIN